MKHTKENILKLLQVMRADKYEISRLYAINGKLQRSHDFLAESTEILRIIRIIENEDTFNRYCEAYEVEGE